MWKVIQFKFWLHLQPCGSELTLLVGSGSFLNLKSFFLNKENKVHNKHKNKHKN